MTNEEKYYRDLKGAFKTLIANINAERKSRREAKLTFYGIDRNGHYANADRELNRVVSFRIKECPGWLFGVWFESYENRVIRLSAIDDDDSHSYVLVKGEFFAQYERSIDKFKPTSSPSAAAFSVVPGVDGVGNGEILKAVDHIEYIIGQPYLAWARDLYMWDYNTRYVSPEEAKKLFRESEEGAAPKQEGQK